MTCGTLFRHVRRQELPAGEAQSSHPGGDPGAEGGGAAEEGGEGGGGAQAPRGAHEEEGGGTAGKARGAHPPRPGTGSIYFIPIFLFCRYRMGQGVFGS